jgi:drug/metabolite transporter (DMT)-like permease
LKAWKAELFLVFMTFVWGGTFVFTQIGLRDCSPSLYIIIRFSISLSISLLFFGKHFLTIDKKTFYQGIILGLMFGGGFVLQTYGLKLTSVPKSAFITGISVILTPFAHWFVERKKIHFWQKIGVIIVAIGLWLFTQPDFDNLNWGDVLTLFSTAFWAFYITYMEVFTRGRIHFAETMQLVITQFIGATSIAVITLLLFDTGNLEIQISNSLIISLIYNGVLASFVLTVIHTSVQRYTTPVKAALIFSLEPVVATTIAVIVLGASLTLIENIGATILLLGVVASEFGEYSIWAYIKIYNVFKKNE